MTREEFFRAMEQSLAIDPGAITGRELLQDLPGWDSMATVSIMAMADESLHQQVSATQLAGCKSVEDIIALFPGKIS